MSKKACAFVRIGLIATFSTILVILRMSSQAIWSVEEDVGYDSSPQAGIRILTGGPLSDGWQSGGTFIAAGGLDDKVHQADVRIEIEPIPGPDHPVEVSLTGGGGGHELGFWPLKLDAVKAKLTLGGKIYTHGQRRPLRFVSPRLLEGRLVSSNLKESTTIRVRIPSRGVVASSTVWFDEGDLHKIVRPGWQKEPHKWHPIDIYISLDGIPMPGHDLALAARSVELKDGTVLEAKLGSNVLSCVGLHDYVELNPADRLNHRYFRAMSGDTFPSAQAKFRVIHPDVVDVRFAVADLSVLVPPQSPEQSVKE